MIFRVKNVGCGKGHLVVQRGSYSALTNAKDQAYLEIIRDFNTYDLYTKSQKIYALEEVRDYYQPIAEKYLGKGPIYW